MKKKVFVIILSMLLALGAMFSLVGCNVEGKEKPEKLAYVSLDINPAVELIVDKNNNVVSVRGENEDGQVLLYEEVGIEGEKIDVAINKITDLAIKYGYLDENNKVVDTIVTSGDSGFASEILEKVNTSITVTASDLGLEVTTDGEGAYSLLRKYDKIKKAFPNNAAVQNMSVAKFKLALSVSETGEISLEAAAELDEAKLLEMRKTASAKVEKFATDAYAVAKATALASYDRVTELASHSVYTQYYLSNLGSHLNTAYYGGAYQMYASAATGFDAICDVAELAAKAENYPLDDGQIYAVVSALGIESADVLKDADGNVTVKSIEAYADKLFKNSPASAALDSAKAELAQALSTIDGAVKQKAAELAEEYKPQIDAAIESARNIADTVDGMLKVLPDVIKNAYESSVNDLKEILAKLDAALADGKIELAELKGFVSELEAKANGYLVKIKNDLTDEEWAQLEEKKAAEIAKYAKQKEELEKSIDKAAQAAKDYLAGLKAERLPA